MALSADDLVEIQALLGAAGPLNAAVAELRRRFPALSLTRCDADDVTEPPFLADDRVDLHLLDTVDHCAKLTTDPARATGLVIAQKRAAP